MSRSTRNQPFCWQEKEILRLFGKKFKGLELVKYRNLYLTITQMDSDFNGTEIKHYTRSIAEYSGLLEAWIPKGLKELKRMNIIEIIEERENGKRRGKHLIFTPEKLGLKGQKANSAIPNNSNPNNSNPNISNPQTSEDSIYIEDNKRKEDTTEEAYMKLPTTGKDYELTTKKLDEYKETYKNVNVEQELLKARQWLRDNPKSTKTHRGMSRFLNGWLSRAKPVEQEKDFFDDYTLTEEEVDKIMGWDNAENE